MRLGLTFFKGAALSSNGLGRMGGVCCCFLSIFTQSMLTGENTSSTLLSAAHRRRIVIESREAAGEWSNTGQRNDRFACLCRWSRSCLMSPWQGIPLDPWIAPRELWAASSAGEGRPSGQSIQSTSPLRPSSAQPCRVIVFPSYTSVPAPKPRDSVPLPSS